MLTPRKGHEALRRGRASIENAQYFLTVCTRDRRPALTVSAVSAAIFNGLKKMEVGGDWHVRTAVVMPDHVHLLVGLGETVELASVVRLFKGRLTPILRNAGLQWQYAYFDHRMRPHDDALAVFLYIFLNPYREGLVKQSEVWPGYYCCSEDWKWFGAMTDQSVPVPEWLA